VVNSAVWMHILLGHCWCMCSATYIVIAPKHVGAVLM